MPLVKVNSITLIAVVLNGIIKCHYTECRHAERHYMQCRSSECHWTKFKYHYDQYNYAERR